jgi:hypothetical protein
VAAAVLWCTLCAVYEDFSREQPADATNSAYTTEPVTRSTTTGVNGAVASTTASHDNNAVDAVYSACGVQGLYLRCVCVFMLHYTCIVVVLLHCVRLTVRCSTRHL